MSQSAQVPQDLTEWVKVQITALKALVGELEMINTHESDDAARWVLNLLEELGRAETISRRGVHLLTTYALREQLASPTVVARRSQVTVTAAQNRAGSKLAQAVWAEVWPREDRA